MSVCPSFGWFVDHKKYIWQVTFNSQNLILLLRVCGSNLIVVSFNLSFIHLNEIKKNIRYGRTDAWLTSLSYLVLTWELMWKIRWIRKIMSFRFQKVVDMKKQNDTKSSPNTFGTDVFGATNKPAYQSQASLGSSHTLDQRDVRWSMRSKQSDLFVSSF